MNKILLVTLLGLFSTSCYQTRFISNGAKDNKPILFEDEYECKNLEEIKLEGTAFWGIPKSTDISKAAKHNSGRIVSFNGVRISGSTKILPILGMLGYTAFVGANLSVIFGLKVDYVDNWGNEFYKPRLPLIPAMILGLPIAGSLNNLTFSNSALGVAGSGINYKLIVDNPEVDVFYYPKYEISNDIKFWTQKAYLKANVKGATQILSTPKNNSNFSKNSNSDATIKSLTKLSIDQDDLKTLKNWKNLMKNDEVILDYNNIIYRGRFIKIRNGKASLKNIEKKSSGKWIAVYEDYEKVYDFPTTTILGYK